MVHTECFLAKEANKNKYFDVDQHIINTARCNRTPCRISNESSIKRPVVVVLTDSCTPNSAETSYNRNRETVLKWEFCQSGAADRQFMKEVNTGKPRERRPWNQHAGHTRSDRNLGRGERSVGHHMSLTRCGRTTIGAQLHGDRLAHWLYETGGSLAGRLCRRPLD